MTKRFICGLGFPINSDDPIRIISDRVEDKDYYKFSDICNILNEQQATIEQQEQSIIILKQEIADTQAILEMLSEKLKGWNNE